MNLETGRPDHIQDYLARLHKGLWYSFSDPNNSTYENLIILDKTKTKPTEQECIDGLAKLQSDFDTVKTNAETKKASGRQKLLDLGLDEDEVKALIGA